MSHLHDICRNPRSACCSCCRFLLAGLHGIREAALSVDSARVCVVDELVERLGDQDRVLAGVVSRRQAIREGWLHRVAVTVCRDERGRILVHRRSEQLSRFPTSTNRPGLAWAFSSQTRSPARWCSGDSCGEGSSTRRELADAEDVDRRLQERLRHRPKPTQESLHPGAFGCFLPHAEPAYGRFRYEARPAPGRGSSAWGEAVHGRSVSIAVPYRSDSHEVGAVRPST